jgi:hypothetical protein
MAVDQCVLKTVALFGARAMPVIAIPLALRRAASGAVHPADAKSSDRADEVIE